MIVEPAFLENTFPQDLQTLSSPIVTIHTILILNKINISYFWKYFIIAVILESRIVGVQLKQPLFSPNKLASNLPEFIIIDNQKMP